MVYYVGAHPCARRLSLRHSSPVTQQPRVDSSCAKLRPLFRSHVHRTTAAGGRTDVIRIRLTIPQYLLALFLSFPIKGRRSTNRSGRSLRAARLQKPSVSPSRQLGCANTGPPKSHRPVRAAH